MSAGVGIWKGAMLKAVRLPVREAAVAASSPGLNRLAPAPLLSLVRQVFFPAAEVRRKQVLFAAADAETKVVSICEQVGRTLAEVSGATVAIIEASEHGAAPVKFQSRPSRAAAAEWWRSHSSRIGENLWRMPASLLTGQSHRGGPERSWAAEAGDLPFDYVLFAAVVTDSETPTFCRLCDGAVLVLTANQTRRESARRAREYLLQCNAELLGSVLDGRTFPVPEAVYRRL